MCNCVQSEMLVGRLTMAYLAHYGLMLGQYCYFDTGCGCLKYNVCYALVPTERFNDPDHLRRRERAPHLVVLVVFEEVKAFNIDRRLRLKETPKPIETLVPSNDMTRFQNEMVIRIDMSYSNASGQARINCNHVNQKRPPLSGGLYLSRNELAFGGWSRFGRGSGSGELCGTFCGFLSLLLLL